MNNNKVVQGVILAMLIMSIGLHFSYTHAEESKNIIQLSIGETLEITTDTASQGAEYSWILTKDRKFLSGQRTRFFQTRLAEIGTYTLDVSIQNIRTGENALHTFSIIVGDIHSTLLPPEQNPRDLALQAIAETQPSLVNGAIYLPPQGGIVKIDSSKSEGRIDKYWIDLDSTIDSDSDGIPTNDHDNIGTFSEKAGTPIYLYAFPKQTPRSIHLSVQDLSGSEPSTRELPLQFSATPAISTTSPYTINGNIVIEKNDLTIRVSSGENGSSFAGRQLLYEWDFGDKNRSLLESPTHSFVSAGTYTISLAIRDITTGEVLQNFSKTIQVSEEISNSVSSVSSSVNTSENGGGSFSIWGALKVVFIIFCLLALALSLYALVAWVKRRSTQSIQETLEKIEGKIVKNNQDDDEKKAPAPMNLKKDTVELSPKKNITDVTEREKSKADFQKQRTNEAPTASAGPVPAWLKKAPEPTSPPMAPTPATKPPQNKIEEKTPVPKVPIAPPPTPAPKVPIPAPPPTKAPAAVPAVKSEPTTAQVQASNSAPDGPVPAWLKPSTQEKSPNPSTAVSQQKIEKPVSPTPPANQEPVTPTPKPKSNTPVANPVSTPPATLAKSGDIPQKEMVKPETEEKKESTDNSDPTIAIIKADSLS